MNTVDPVASIKAMFHCPYRQLGNLWQVPRKPKFNANSYPARVRYAVWAIAKGDHSRNHDTCFEMYDGAAVVTAIMRAVQSGDCDYLAQRLRNDCLTDTGWDSWLKTASNNGFWDDDQLSHFAQCLREEGRALARAGFDGQVAMAI